jgi:hypothetical protein
MPHINRARSYEYGARYLPRRTAARPPGAMMAYIG